MDDDELQEALTALGSSHVADPDSGFAHELEERMRHLHGTAGAGRKPASAPRRLQAVAAVAVLVVTVGALLVQRSGDSTTRLTAATDTSLVLPDGSVVVAVKGAALPDGALVVTGPDGSARVDGVPIPESSQVVIQGGAARSVSSPTSTSPPLSAPPTSVSSGSDPGTTPTKPPTTTSTATSDEPVRMELAARAEPVGAVWLRWSMYPDPDFDRYVLVRTAWGNDKSESTTVVFSTHDRGVLTFRDQLPAGVARAGYRVIALDRAGRVVGASPLVHA